MQRMLWFRQFFRLSSDGIYELHPEPAQAILAGSSVGMHLMDSDDEDDDEL